MGRHSVRQPLLALSLVSYHILLLCCCSTSLAFVPSPGRPAADVNANGQSALSSAASRSQGEVVFVKHAGIVEAEDVQAVLNMSNSALGRDLTGEQLTVLVLHDYSHSSGTCPIFAADRGSERATQMQACESDIMTSPTSPSPSASSGPAMSRRVARYAAANSSLLLQLSANNLIASCRGFFTGPREYSGKAMLERVMPTWTLPSHCHRLPAVQASKETYRRLGVQADSLRYNLHPADSGAREGHKQGSRGLGDSLAVFDDASGSDTEGQGDGGSGGGEGAAWRGKVFLLRDVFVDSWGRVFNHTHLFHAGRCSDTPREVRGHAAVQPRMRASLPALCVIASRNTRLALSLLAVPLRPCTRYPLVLIGCLLFCRYFPCLPLHSPFLSSSSPFPPPHVCSTSASSSTSWRTRTMSLSQTLLRSFPSSCLSRQW